MITSRYDQRELITADAREKSAGGRCLQTTHDLAQQRITDRMSELVIGFFEAVEVDAQNRELLPVCRGPLQCGCNSFIEGCPIGDICEIVIMRHMRDALLSTPPLGHIINDSQQVLWLGIFVANDGLLCRYQTCTKMN